MRLPEIPTTPGPCARCGGSDGEARAVSQPRVFTELEDDDPTFGLVYVCRACAGRADHGQWIMQHAIDANR